MFIAEFPIPASAANAAFPYLQELIRDATESGKKKSYIALGGKDLPHDVRTWGLENKDGPLDEYIDFLDNYKWGGEQYIGVEWHIVLMFSTGWL